MSGPWCLILLEAAYHRSDKFSASTFNVQTKRRRIITTWPEDVLTGQDARSAPFNSAHQPSSKRLPQPLLWRTNAFKPNHKPRP
jgi:hypothetical protein